MKAIQFTEYGSYDKLKLVDLPMPVLEDGQLLVKVKLAAVNPVDAQRFLIEDRPFGKVLLRF